MLSVSSTDGAVGADACSMTRLDDLLKVISARTPDNNYPLSVLWHTKLAGHYLKVFLRRVAGKNPWDY